MNTKIALRSQDIVRAEPAAAPYRIWDTKVPGLYVRIQPSGVKTFNVLWSRNRSIALGKFPGVTVDIARARALAALAETATEGAPALVKKREEPPAATELTFGVFVRDHYEPHVLATAKAGKATIDNLTAQFEHLFGRPIASISRLDFDDFKAQRMRDGLHPSTINRDMDRIKAALSQAVEWKLLDANPLRGLKRLRRGIEDRVRFLSKPEEKALRKALDARDAAASARRTSGNAWRAERGQDALPAIKGYAGHLTPMVLLALNTGMRRGELTQLTWADVNIAGKLLTVRAGYAKSGKARHLPLNAEALTVLRALRKARPGDGRLFDITAVTKSWDGICASAKLVDFRFHDLRHTFASKLVMAGVDLNTVRELLGHGDIKMTLRYAHLAPEHKRAAVDLLGK